MSWLARWTETAVWQADGLVLYEAGTNAVTITGGNHTMVAAATIVRFPSVTMFRVEYSIPRWLWEPQDICCLFSHVLPTNAPSVHQKFVSPLWPSDAIYDDIVVNAVSGFRRLAIHEPIPIYCQLEFVCSPMYRRCEKCQRWGHPLHAIMLSLPSACPSRFGLPTLRNRIVLCIVLCYYSGNMVTRITASNLVDPKQHSRAFWTRTPLCIQTALVSRSCDTQDSVYFTVTFVWMMQATKNPKT